MFGCAVTKVYVGICAVRRTSGSSISPHRLKRQLYRMEATVWPVCMSHIRVRSLSHARRKRSSGAKEVLWTLSKRPNNCRRASFRTSATNEAPGGRARVGQRRVVVVGLNDVCASHLVDGPALCVVPHDHCSFVVLRKAAPSFQFHVLQARFRSPVSTFRPAGLRTHGNPCLLGFNFHTPCCELTQPGRSR